MYSFSTNAASLKSTKQQKKKKKRDILFLFSGAVQSTYSSTIPRTREGIVAGLCLKLPWAKGLTCRILWKKTLSSVAWNLSVSLSDFNSFPAQGFKVGAECTIKTTLCRFIHKATEYHMAGLPGSAVLGCCGATPTLLSSSPVGEVQTDYTSENECLMPGKGHTVRDCAKQYTRISEDAY